MWDSRVRLSLHGLWDARAILAAFPGLDAPAFSAIPQGYGRGLAFGLDTSAPCFQEHIEFLYQLVKPVGISFFLNASAKFV
jgi:hypothetical protein